jgi:hypothetical protein
MPQRMDQFTAPRPADGLAEAIAAHCREPDLRAFDSPWCAALQMNRPVAPFLCAASDFGKLVDRARAQASSPSCEKRPKACESCELNA